MWWKKTKKQNKEVPNTHRIPTFLHPRLFSNISENMMQKKKQWHQQVLSKMTVKVSSFAKKKHEEHDYKTYKR